MVSRRTSIVSCATDSVHMCKQQLVSKRWLADASCMVVHLAMAAWLTSLISIDLPGDGVKLTLQALQHLMAIPLVDPIPIHAVIAHWPTAANIRPRSLRHATKRQIFTSMNSRPSFRVVAGKMAM